MACLRLAVTRHRTRIINPCASRNFTSTVEPASPLSKAAYLSLFALTAGVGAVYYFDSRAAIHRYLFTPIIRHVLDPESSHKLALSVLESGLGPRDMLTDDEQIKAEVKCVMPSTPTTQLKTLILSSGDKHCQTQSVSQLGLIRMDGQSTVWMHRSHVGNLSLRRDGSGLFNLGFGWVEIGSVTPKPQVRIVQL
jgi:dihydroorotate dehydrogenase